MTDSLVDRLQAASKWNERYGLLNDAELMAEAAEVIMAARDLITEGLRLTPGGLIVLEKADKTDPHYRLCVALENAGLIPSKGKK